LSISSRISAWILILFAFGAFADDGGSYTLLSGGSRDLAMAGAAHLHDAGLEALFLQPASLSSLDRWEVGAFTQLYGDGVPLQHGTLAFAFASGHRMALDGRYESDSEMAVGAAFQYLSATLADDSGWSEWTLAAVAAWSPMRWFSLGGRARYSGGGSEDAVDRGHSTAMDFGLRLRLLHPGLEAGLLMQDFYHRFAWDEGGDARKEPRLVTSLGMAGLRLPYLPGDLRLEARMTQHRSSAESFGLGMEWSLLDGLADLRGGLLAWRQGEERISPTFGFGLLAGLYRVDYAYSPDVDGGMAAQHRIAIIRSGS